MEITPELLYGLLGFIISTLISILILLTKEVWRGKTSEITMLRRDLLEYSRKLDQNSQLHHKNTMAITEHTVELRNVKEKLDIVGELQRDVQKMGVVIRELRSPQQPQKKSRRPTKNQ